MANYSPNVCPKCGEIEYRRIGRKWYMRLIPGTKRYCCCQCGAKFISFFWVMLIGRRPV